MFKYTFVFFFIIFYQYVGAQVITEEFSSDTHALRDSLVLYFNEDAKTIRLVSSYQDYALFQSTQKPIIYIFNLKDRSLIKQESPLFAKAIDGFGVPNPDTFYVILEQCGEKGIHCVTIDVKNNQILDHHLKNYNASYGIFRVINGKHYFLLSRFFKDYALYDITKKKMLYKQKLGNIFDMSVAGRFEHPNGLVNFLSDTIIAFNYTGNGTIFLIHAKKGKILSTIANPHQSIYNHSQIFYTFDNEKKLNEKIVQPFTKFYSIYLSLKSFKYQEKPYYYQFAILSREEKDTYPVRLTIWNENFEIIHNFYMPHSRFFIDGAGNLYSYSHRTTGVMVNFYGPIVQTKSLRTTMKE